MSYELVVVEDATGKRKVVRRFSDQTTMLSGVQGPTGAQGPMGAQQFYVGGTAPAPIAIPILWFQNSTAPNAQAGDYDVDLIT